MNTKLLVRRLGIICMVYAAIFSFVGIWEVLSPSIGEHYLGDNAIFNPSQWRIKLLLLALPGFFAGKLGYYLSGAAGRNWFSKAVLVLAALGAVMSMLGQIHQAMTLRDAAVFGIPLFGLGMPLGQWVSTFLLGVAALFAKRVTVWKRVWPMWLGVAPQVIFPLYIFVFGWPAFAALATNGLNWLVFGYLVFSEGGVGTPETVLTPRQLAPTLSNSTQTYLTRSRTPKTPGR